MSNQDSALKRLLPHLGKLFSMLARESQEEAAEKARMSREEWVNRERTANQHWAHVTHALVTGESAVPTGQLVNAISHALRAFTSTPGEH